MECGLGRIRALYSVRIARHVTAQQRAPDELRLQAVTLAELAVGECCWCIVTAGVCHHVLPASPCQVQNLQPWEAAHCAIVAPQATQGPLRVT